MRLWLAANLETGWCFSFPLLPSCRPLWDFCEEISLAHGWPSAWFQPEIGSLYHSIPIAPVHLSIPANPVAPSAPAFFTSIPQDLRRAVLDCWRQMLSFQPFMISFEGVEHCFQDMFFSPQMDKETWIQRKNLAETSDNCQVSQVHGFFYGASLPLFKPSVPGWDDSENLHSYLQVALPSSAHGPQDCLQDYPWDGPLPIETSSACVSGGGRVSFFGWLWYLLLLQVLSPSPSVPLLSQVQSLLVNAPGLCHERPLESWSRSVAWSD